MRVAIEAASLSLSSGGLARYTCELSLALGRCFPEDEFFLVSDQPFRMPSPAPANLKCGGGPRNAMERRWWLWGLAREMGRLGADLRNSYVWIAVLTLLAYGAIGFVDDYSKVAQHRNLGLTARRKMLYQIGAAFVMAAVLMFMRTFGGYSTVMNVPFLKRFKPTLLISGLLASPWTYALGVLPFFIFVAVVIVGASNGVN